MRVPDVQRSIQRRRGKPSTPLRREALAAATVDRLLHHAHVLITDGIESYRLAQAGAGKGVRPLT